MRAFDNKITEIQHHEEDRKLNYVDLIAICINNPVEGGYSVDEMQARLRLKAVTSEANGVIKLENADHDKLKAIVKKAKWNLLHENIVEFNEAVESAKEVKK